MGISNWVVTEAKKIIEAAKHKDTIIFETGYGPSGLPHIGTFAENARTCFVIEAVKQLAPQKKCQLLVFSDDFDGLRKIPLNIENGDIMQPYLGAPLTSVPSPFDPERSFGDTNNEMLRRFLDSFGFTYTFLSATAQYSGGVFDAALKVVMDHYETVRKIVSGSIGEDKRENWSPFIARCAQCTKINTTGITSYNPEKYTVSYCCDQNTDEYRSCGHAGETSILGGAVKVGWKVDWALRWAVLGVDYEMHGEDLSESVKVSKKLCQALWKTAPITFKYELFLDDEKKKISKKLGNGLSMEQWIAYAPLAALVRFLLGNPNTSKSMGMKVLPGIIDDFLAQLSKETEDDMTAALWYLNKFEQAKLPVKPGKISFTLLISVLESVGQTTPDVLFDFAKRYDPDIAQDEGFYLKLCEHAVNYFLDVPTIVEECKPDQTMLPYLKNIEQYLLDQTSEQLDGDSMQSFLFSIAKSNELHQRHWFVFLYNVFLGKSSGPKMGPFFAMLGKSQALLRVQTKIAEFTATV